MKQRKRTFAIGDLVYYRWKHDRGKHFDVGFLDWSEWDGPKHFLMVRRFDDNCVALDKHAIKRLHKVTDFPE